MITVKILGQKYTIEYLTLDQDSNLSEDTGDMLNAIATAL